MKKSRQWALVLLASLAILFLGLAGWWVGTLGNSPEQPPDQSSAPQPLISTTQASPVTPAAPQAAPTPIPQAVPTTFKLLASPGQKFPTPSGLVHRYTFNDGTANDSVGKAHGTLEGGATIKDGELVLNGTRGQQVSLPSSGPDNAAFINFNRFDTVTVQCWFTLNSKNPAANRWGEFFSFGGTSPANGTGYAYVLGVARDGWSGGMTRAVIENSPEQPQGTDYDPRPWESQAIGHDPITDLEKHQFTLCIGTASILYYLDGKLINFQPLQTTPAGPTSLSTISPQRALIGGSVWQPDPSFAGKIDELSIFDRALKPEEILTTFQTGPVQ